VSHAQLSVTSETTKPQNNTIYVHTSNAINSFFSFPVVHVLTWSQGRRRQYGYYGHGHSTFGVLWPLMAVNIILFCTLFMQTSVIDATMFMFISRPVLSSPTWHCYGPIVHVANFYSPMGGHQWWALTNCLVVITTSQLLISTRSSAIAGRPCDAKACQG